MSAADDWESEAGPATQASHQAPVPPELGFVDAEEEDDEDVLEVEPEPAGEEELALHRAAAPAGSVAASSVAASSVASGAARAASSLQSSLHTLLQIESLSRTTGVFLVLSGDDSGYLHLVEGELMHAETGRLSGEAAAQEILSWRDASLEPSLRTLAPVRTVHSSLQGLLGHAGAEVGSQPGPQQTSRVAPRASAPGAPLDQDAPTETYLPPVSAAPAAVSGAELDREAAAGEGRAAQKTAAQTTAAQTTVAQIMTAAEVPSEEPARASALPRSVLPPPLPRAERESPSTVAEVVVSAAGELVQGRGAASEELAARVAYAARLAELIGRAIRSGTPRAVELRGKTTQTLVRWQADGNLSASLDLPQPSRR
ncbi:MAG TPA: DUF4388 domain-containing protein [Polyangiaceae bacterium]|jgi:hypothetical protein|nr:DUF4388 domain-containing protein [Polyangiaceae bacterium]